MSALARTPDEPREIPFDQVAVWLGGIGALILVLVVDVVRVRVYTAPVDTVGKVAFEQPLAIPPLANSRVDLTAAGFSISRLNQG